MEQRPLGKTGMQVSVVCLGTMTFGEQNTEADAHEQLDYAVANGVNFIDTAEIYAVPPRAETYGLTEQYIGTWLKRRGGRDKIVLATKVAGPSDMKWARGGKENTRHTRAQIFSAIDESLRRLQTDFVDLYQLHWPDRNANYFGAREYRHDPGEQMTPLRESVEALAELVKAGKIRAFGLSNETPWGVCECLRLADGGLPRPESVQNPYNLLNRSYEIGMAEMSAREDCGLLAYSPLAFGVLSGKYLGGKKPEGARLTLWGDRFGRYGKPDAVRATEAYVSLARKRGLNPAQMALAFTIARPFLTSSIIGATTMEQLRENIAAAEVALDAETMKELDAIHERHPNPAV